MTEYLVDMPPRQVEAASQEEAIEKALAGIKTRLRAYEVTAKPDSSLHLQKIRRCVTCGHSEACHRRRDECPHGECMHLDCPCLAWRVDK